MEPRKEVLALERIPGGVLAIRLNGSAASHPDFHLDL